MTDQEEIDIRDDDKIHCEICEKELWMLNSKTLRGLDDDLYMVCGSCYQDFNEEKMHTI